MNKDILNVIVESVSQVYEHRAVTDRRGQFLQEIHRCCVINSKGTSSLVNGLPVESPHRGKDGLEFGRSNILVLRQSVHKHLKLTPH